MSEVTWFGTVVALLAGFLSLPIVQAQYVQLYGDGPEPYQRSLQRSLPSYGKQKPHQFEVYAKRLYTGVELANLLQRLLRDAALLRKRSTESSDGQPGAIPPGFVGARGRRHDVILEQPPGFVGARGKRGSSVPLFLASLAEAGADSSRSQIDRPLGSQ
ncbi:hypothetical protein MRX96_037938 [Rhipicephalus microplus]